MLAKDVQGKISKFCLKRKIPYNKTIAMSKAGWPDCMVVIAGITYYFEVKVGKDALSALQIHVIKHLNTHRKIAFVIANFNEFKTIYKELKNVHI